MLDLQLLPSVPLFASPERYLWHPPSQTAILSDLHLGSAESLAKGGLYLEEASAVANRAMQEAWAAICRRKPQRVVIAGDLFDSPRVSSLIHAQARELLDRLRTQIPDCEIVFTPGNHDPLEPTFREILGSQVVISPHWASDGLFVSHGHEFPTSLKKNAVWIAGHQHPSVHLHSRVHDVKMTCFAVCDAAEKKWQGKMILLPAFSRMPLGCDLLSQRQWLMPLPWPANNRIRIAGIVESKDRAQVLNFGTLADLQVV